MKTASVVLFQSNNPFFRDNLHKSCSYRSPGWRPCFPPVVSLKYESPVALTHPGAPSEVASKQRLRGSSPLKLLRVFLSFLPGFPALITADADLSTNHVEDCDEEQELPAVPPLISVFTEE